MCWCGAVTPDACWAKHTSETKSRAKLSSPAGWSTGEARRPRQHRLLRPERNRPESAMNIHPTAIVDPTAKVPASCKIGAYCVVGANVELGENCRSEEHTSELQSLRHLVCRLL